MSEMLAAIQERAYRRRELWQHEFLKTKFPFPIETDEFQIVGSYSRIYMNSRRRVVLLRDEVQLDSHLIETPPTVARDFLVLQYKRGPRVKNWQVESLEEDRKAAPLFAKPCSFGEGWYLDVRSTFWAIMGTVGWDVDYWPEKWLGRGLPPFDFPFPDHKISRNCLVSAGSNASLPIWNPNHKQIEPVKHFNKLANPGLIRLITDVLNSLAAEMCKIGAVYVHTDGYIFVSESALKQAEQMIRDWGLDPRIKGHGAGWVKGPGIYKVGGMKSAIQINEPTFFNQVHRPGYWHWLQDRFSRFAALAA